MEWAKSVLLGGELVSAKNADYTDAKKLILVCPFCNEGVYLIKGHPRKEHARLAPKSKQIVLVKQAEIANSFGHFHKLANDCELKATQISKEAIARAATAAKGQRLKFLRNRLGSILFTENESFSINIQERLLKDNKGISLTQAEKIEQELEDGIVTIYRDSIPGIKKKAKELVELSKKKPALVTNTKEAIEWLKKLEGEIHLKIIEEVLEFLATKSAEPILRKCVKYGMKVYLISFPEKNLNFIFTKTQRELEEKFSNTIEQTITGIVGFIMGIPWIDVLK
jgi:hypothetical protein